jgi:hypothetical protein
MTFGRKPFDRTTQDKNTASGLSCTCLNEKTTTLFWNAMFTNLMLLLVIKRENCMFLNRDRMFLLNAAIKGKMTNIDSK